jgi:hypothetical protein
LATLFGTPGFVAVVIVALLAGLAFAFMVFLVVEEAVAVRCRTELMRDLLARGKSLAEVRTALDIHKDKQSSRRIRIMTVAKKTSRLAAFALTVALCGLLSLPASASADVALAHELAQRLLSKKIGEEGAWAYAKQQGYQPVLTGAGRIHPHGPDGVYLDVRQVHLGKDGTVVAIEAKGNWSRPRQGYGSPQGSPEWAIRGARRWLTSPVASDAERRAAVLILEAARDEKLVVEVVRTMTGETVGKRVNRAVSGKPAAREADQILKELAKEVAAVHRAATTATKTAVVAAETVTRTGTVVFKTTAGAGKGAVAAGEGTTAVSKGTTAVSKGAKVLGPVVGLAAEVVTRGPKAADIERDYKDGRIDQGERVARHVENGAGAVGGLAGAWAGAKAGAALGAITINPVVVGAAAVVGAVAGYFGGEYVAERFVGGLRRLWR